MSPSADARGRILVVDDDRVLRHALSTILADAGYTVAQASDGPEALTCLARAPADLVLLDLGLPGMSGLDVLTQVRGLTSPPRVVVVTADDTPGTLLKAIAGQADGYVTKPFAPGGIVDVIDDVLAKVPATALPIEVISARPEWVELLAPCSIDVANRIQGFMMTLEADLPEKVRESVGQAFHELLFNGVEWGGKLDPSRKVRISCIRTRRMLLYRIADPGEGFDIGGLSHAAINNPEDDPLQHAMVREEKGLRPGGLGLAITRTLVDELVYNEKRNEVVFVKYLDRGRPCGTAVQNRRCTMHLVPRVPPFDRPATYDDLADLPDDVVAEILDGELHASPRPAPRVAAAAVVLGRMLFRPPGGHAAPGGWQILPEPELHLGADILVPRLAAWRESRLPNLPGTAYFSLPPDWICEIASSGTASFRARKMAIYAVERVSHAWLIDPVARTIEARRLENGRWTSVATHVHGEVVHLEPFEAIDLPLGLLWGDND